MALSPHTLFGRTIFVIAMVLITTQAITIFLFRAYNKGPLFEEMAALITGQLRVISAALESLPSEEKIDFLDILEETQGIRVVPDTAGKLPTNEPKSQELLDFTEYVRNELGEDTEFFIQHSGAEALWVRLTVNKEKYWISIPRKQIERGPPWFWLGWLGICAFLVLVGAYLLVRRVNWPLRKLTHATHQLGAGKTPPRLNESGPYEIREVSRAFNKMADDIQNHEAERTLLLAGISHDLRTPLSRLRVSLDLTNNIEDDLRNGMVHDIEEIDAIIQQFLDFARIANNEKLELVNLSSLAELAAKRYTALGEKVIADTIPTPPILLRPTAMQRLLDNLITNALQYAGGEIIIRTAFSEDQFILSVLDRGPGIDKTQIDRLKRPFTRLETARSNAGHTGLGLAIVERISTLHNAKFDLLPREGGGLEAKIIFSQNIIER